MNPVEKNEEHKQLLIYKFEGQVGNQYLWQTRAMKIAMWLSRDIFSG